MARSHFSWKVVDVKRYKARKRLLLFLACSFLLVPPLVSGDEASVRFSSPTFSRSKRFALLGGDATDRAQIGIWVEDLVKRVEQRLGEAVPFAPQNYMLIAIKEKDGGGAGTVASQQEYDRGMLLQEIRITNIASLDQEELLEHLVRLLLQRVVLARQQHMGGVGSHRNADVPLWFSVGFAQQLYPSLRSRNAEKVCQWVGEHRPKSFQSLLRYRYLPEGRWLQKAMLGVAVDWLFSWSNSEAVIDMLFQRWAVGKTVEGEELVTFFTKAPTPDGLEQGWTAWLQRLATVKRFAGSPAENPFAVLERVLALEVQMGDSGKMREISWRQLIEARETGWVAVLTQTLRLKIKSLAIGEAEPLQEVITGYANFLEALDHYVQREKPLPAHVEEATALQLAELLLSAEQAKDRLRQQHAFLDSAEARFLEKVNEPRGPSSDSSSTYIKAKTVLDLYVDEVELQHEGE